MLEEAQDLGRLICLGRGERADRLVVDKGARALELYAGETRLLRHPVRLGFEPDGPKRREGDGRTPEGRYRIVGRNARSPYYLSLRIGYPTPQQQHEARAEGRDPGGDIVIHGTPNWAPWAGPLLKHWDWTRGCIAVSNREMEALWQRVPNGAVIEIRP